jgi:tRNA (guanine-N7-)-methyltransferase
MSGDRDTPGPVHGSEGGGRPSLYGRRRGRPLRPGRRRLLEELLPQIAVALPPTGERLDPDALFAQRPEALWLEIGFGSGEHLAWQAARHPGVGFLGAEVFVNGVAALLRRIDEHGLENVRVLQGDGRALLDVLPAACLERVFILFPDPWPKARHHKRRLIRRETLSRLATLMADGAELRLATDDPDYQRWILERATTHPAFAWLAEGPADWRARPADWPPTRYEQKAIAQGRQPLFLRFRRRPRRRSETPRPE